MKVIKIDFEKLQKHAEEERWSNAAIAKKTGLSVMGISKILKGEVDPQATNLKKVCDTIGIPIEEAFIERAAA